jgi:apolipoprotein N-acyltransferase
MGPMFDIPDIKELLYKIAIVFGAIIVIYGVLWLLVNLGVIPAIIAEVFPQIVLIIIGLFIIYAAIDRRNKYY